MADTIGAALHARFSSEKQADELARTGVGGSS
jgi:hypothetical protein